MIMYQLFLIALFIVVATLNSKIKSNIVFIANIVVSVLLTCFNVLIGMEANVIPKAYIIVNIVIDIIYIIVALILAYMLIRKNRKIKVNENTK